MKQSGLFKLNIPDFVKAALMLAIGSIATGFLAALQNGGVMDWKAILTGGIVCGGSYLVKNLFTNSTGTPLMPEPTK